MEVKANLLESERREILNRFSMPFFKKVANIVMGEPSTEYKKTQQAKMLQEKQAKSDAAWKQAKAEKKRKKEAEKRAKQFAEGKKKAEEAAKERAETEAKKKADAEAKKKGEDKKE